jgi:hypothetical protein
MRKALFIVTGVVLVVIAVLVTLAMSKPDRMAHYDALKGVVLKAVEMKVNEAIPDEDLRTMGTYMALNAVDEYLKKNLFFYEKTFYNEGFLLYNSQPVFVSVGVMGHVFLTFEGTDAGKLMDRIDVLKMIEDEDVRKQIKSKIKN